MKYIKNIIFFILLTGFCLAGYVATTLSRHGVYKTNDFVMHLKISVVIGITIAFLVPLSQKLFNQKSK